MSNTARPGEIDALVSSVRDFVGNTQPVGRRRRTKSELLVLSQAFRVDGEDVVYAPLAASEPVVSDHSNVLHLDPAQQPPRASLEATIAELEAAVTSQPEEWEADEGEAFAPDAWAASAFHQPVADSPKPTETRAEMVAQLAKEVEAAIGMNAAPSNPVVEMDIEMLRPMVVQIIREELAGELGEKITRNVRKLVRREINRVLASQDIS